MEAPPSLGGQSAQGGAPCVAVGMRDFAQDSADRDLMLLYRHPLIHSVKIDAGLFQYHSHREVGQKS